METALIALQTQGYAMVMDNRDLVRTPPAGADTPLQPRASQESRPPGAACCLYAFSVELAWAG